MLVAIVIFSIVGGIVASALVQYSRASRVTIASVTTQQLLVTAMTRIGRDIGNAVYLDAGSPTSLTVRGLQGGHCVVSEFTATGTTLTEKNTTLAETDCTNASTVTGHPVPTPLVTGLTTTAIFTYFDASNSVVTASVVTSRDYSAVSRVRYTLSAAVDGRAKPMVLTSSWTLFDCHCRFAAGR